jgi:hypothetical protein
LNEQNFWLSLSEENQNKFLLASTKSLTNCENPSSKAVTLFGELVPAFLKQPVTLKAFPKDGHECTLAKIDQ